MTSCLQERGSILVLRLAMHLMLALLQHRELPR